MICHNEIKHKSKKKLGYWVQIFNEITGKCVEIVMLTNSSQGEACPVKAFKLEHPTWELFVVAFYRTFLYLGAS